MTEPPQWVAPGPPGYAPAGDVRPGFVQPGFVQPGYSAPPPWRPPVVKPGIIPLRPLGLGEILDGAITYIRANPVATLALAAVVTTVEQLVRLPIALLLTGSLLTSPLTPGTTELNLSGLFGSLGVDGLISFVGSTILAGMLIVVLSQAVLGRRIGIGGAWAIARRRLLGLIGVSVLAALAGIGIGVVLLAPALIAGIVGGPPVLVVVLAVLGGLAALAGLVYLSVTWSLAGPVYVLEGGGVIAAFGRSRRLVAPQWGRVFGILLLAGVIASVIAGILAAPFSLGAVLTAGLATDPSATPVALVVVLTAIGTILASTLTGPFTAGATGLLYLDQRMRREGLDIALQRAVAP